jgi:hypothetical protein
MKSARSKVAEPLLGDSAAPPIIHQKNIGASGLVAVMFHIEAVFRIKEPSQ